MEQLLKQFSFSQGEAAVYKILLTLGGAKVSEIAALTKLKRTSCQEYVQSLEQKGFINYTKRGNKFYYQAEDPDKFRQIINERQFIVDRLIPQERARSEKNEWQARSLNTEEIERALRRAKRKGQEVISFGNETCGGALVNKNVVLLQSPDKELPAIEIQSRVIVDLHRELFKTKKPR